MHNKDQILYSIPLQQQEVEKEIQAQEAQEAVEAEVK